MIQRRTTCRRAAGRAIWAWCVVASTMVAMFGNAPASAQQRKPNAKSEAAAPPAAAKPTGRIVDRDMFDRITLDASNNNAVIEVQALDLPNRRVPANPKPDDKLVVRLIGRPSQLFELSWRNIAKIELYEDLLVAEATKLVGLKRYEEAFEYLDAVYRRDPKYPELREAVQYLLYVNAGSYFGQKRYPEALSLLEELYRLNPNYKHPGQNATVGEAISRLIDQIMTRYMAAQDFGMARNMLVRVTSSYGDKQQATVDKWRGELVKLAEAQRDKARQLIDEQKMREALAATNEMLRIWPEVKGAAELDREMADRYPIVLIGVQQAVGGHPDRMDAWASRRISRLGQRKLSEFVGKGPEGGRYESPLGTFESSDDGKQVTLTMRSSSDGNTIPISGYDVARRLIELADPSSKDYSPAWGGLMASVSVDDVTQVKIDLRRPHVLPQALLQITLPLPAGGGGVALGPYSKGPNSPAETSYMVNRQYQFYQSKQPKELVEKIYERSDKAITALKRGDIDMIDRVFPADVFRLKNDSSLTVGQYAIPTIHVLVPNYKKPYTANRTFRRGIAYAINREGMLQSEILGGSAIPGCVALSAPLPAGISTSDPISYAYDETIAPRVYNPRLGLTLLKLAAVELQKQLQREAIAKAEKEKKTAGTAAAAVDPAVAANEAAAQDAAAKDAAAKAAAPAAKPGDKPAEKPGDEPPLPPAPPLEKLKIGHPANEIARVACQSIAMQLEMVKMPVELIELPADKLDDPDGICDFVYSELTVLEPVVDVPRMVGPGGLFEESSPYVGLALRRLEAARSWQDSSTTLKEMHRVLYDDVTVIPLWQLTEHFAYRKWVRGVGDQIVSLYQNVENWQVGLRSAAK